MNDVFARSTGQFEDQAVSRQDGSENVQDRFAVAERGRAAAADVADHLDFMGLQKLRVEPTVDLVGASLMLIK